MLRTVISVDVDRAPQIVAYLRGFYQVEVRRSYGDWTDLVVQGEGVTFHAIQRAVADNFGYRFVAPF